MTHDLNSNLQSEPVKEHQRNPVSALTRRDLLKHVTLAGSMTVTCGATSVTETSEYLTREPDDAETQFGKELIVKGIGTGINEYHIETRGNIRLDEITVGQDGPLGKREFHGGIRKGDSDSYFFTGRVMNVHARGSILYSVSNHDQ